MLLNDNPFAAGMLLTTIMAAALAYMRNIPAYIFKWLIYQITVSVEIKNAELPFRWVSLWLDNQPYSKYARNITVSTYTAADEADRTESFIEDVTYKKKSRPKLLFTPASGSHFLMYKGRPYWLRRIISSASNNNGGSKNGLKDKESFIITTLGRSQAPIRDLIIDAQNFAMPLSMSDTCIIASGDYRWLAPVYRHPRTRKNVILDENVLENLLADVERFLARKEWYNDLCIPYRRGYLLYGIPGSGKTSAVLAIAGELHLDVYIINLGDVTLDDAKLGYLFSTIPPGNIVLLEDIDVAFKTRKTKLTDDDDDIKSHITFSGLLNAIDGAATQDGRILFMTTNYIEQLDEALIRPGRVDVRVKFDYATEYQASRMFIRFYPDVNLSIALAFGAKLKDKKLTMAAIQDHLLLYADDPQAALEAFK